MLDEEQSKAMIDSVQLFDRYMQLSRDSLSTHGSMRWKRVKEKEYLFHGRGSRGYGKSLGVKSEETERVYRDFNSQKKQNATSLKIAKQQLSNLAQINKRLKIQRVPSMVAAVLRMLDQNKLLGTNIRIVGTYALYAYEAAVGIQFASSITATRDFDLLLDSGAKLKLAMTLSEKGLLGLLRQADKSFELVYESNSFRAVNDKGFYIDLIKAAPNPPWHDELNQIGLNEDLVAAPIDSQRWIINAPKFSHVVIGEDGFPARMVVPDPRAFALHKLWLSKQPDREPLKISRDKHQAQAVAQMVSEYMPDKPFDEKSLSMFPEKIVSLKSELPIGFE